MARRTQQDEVYAAQNVLPLGRTFASYGDVQRYVDELRDEPWWPEWVLRVEVTRVADGRFAGLAHWHPDDAAGVIGLTSDGMNLRTVVHELAHVLADARGSMAHDPLYCRQYLELVYHIMGSDAFLALRDSFEKHGVVHDDNTNDGETK